MCAGVCVCFATSPTTDTMVDNFRFHRTNTPRILEERWESHKSVLLDKCQTMTFADLASYMNRVHNFPAK